jgi:peptide methionine sulfoxide reductase MsrA
MKSGIDLELSLEQTGVVVVEELKVTVEINSTYEDQRSKDIVKAAELLLSYYMAPDEHRKYLEQKSS